MSTTSNQSLSSALTVISANIEGLSDLCKEKHCHCLCLQETHRGTRKVRPRIPGMTLVAERPYDKYGSAIFIRDDLKVSISVTSANHVEVITAKLPDVVVHSVYKPPREQFLLPPLKVSRTCGNQSVKSANRIQCFMLSSILSNNRDVVSLVPV